MTELPPPPPSPESFEDLRRVEKRGTDVKKSLRGAVAALLGMAFGLGFLTGVAVLGEEPRAAVTGPAPAAVSPTPIEPVATPEQTKVQADTMLANWEANGVPLEEVCTLTDADWEQVRGIWESQGANPANTVAVEAEIRSRCGA